MQESSFLNFQQVLSAYTKSRAKDKRHLTKKISEYLSSLQQLYVNYELREKIVQRKHLERIFFTYCSIIITTFLECNDFPSIQLLMDEGCVDVSEALIITCMYNTQLLNSFMKEIKHTREEVKENSQTYKRIAKDISCEELSELVEKLEEEDQELTNKKRKKDKLAKLQELMRELSISKEDLMEEDE